MKTFKVTIQIPRQRIIDMFISACEGGSRYWCGGLTPSGRHPDGYKAMLAGFALTDNEAGEKKIKVTRDMIEQAIQDFAQKEPKHFADMMSENDDATTGDVFLQLCCFGKVIYG